VGLDHFYLCNIFGFCLSLLILTIFAPLQSRIIWNKIYHLTLTVMPYYCVSTSKCGFAKKLAFSTYFS